MCSSTIQPSPNNGLVMDELTMSSHILPLQRNEIMQSVISAYGEKEIHCFTMMILDRFVNQASLIMGGLTLA